MIINLNDSAHSDCFFQRTMHIQSMLKDGFHRVCDISKLSTVKRWILVNSNEEILFSNHNSWIYFIAFHDHVYKLGQTGVPLGIRQYYYGGITIEGMFHPQPVADSTNRFGRLSYGDGTDLRIRAILTPLIQEENNDNVVQLWARKCDVLKTDTQVLGNNCTLTFSSQIHLEGFYLNGIKEITGYLPPGNPIKK